MAISSQNNLIYFFVFTEISIALTSMFYTNYNVFRCYLKSISANRVYAHEENIIRVELASSDKKIPYNIFIGWSFSKEKNISAESGEYLISWMPKKRGYQRFPKVHLESKYPFGLLRSWKICQIETQIIVYPRRKGLSEFPKTSTQDNQQANVGLFQELKEFQSGDSPRRIDWRASVRTQKLLVKKFEDQQQVQYTFDWDQTRHLANIEDRISQLALWLDLAEKKNVSYQLILPGWQSSLSQGESQYLLCLEKLATWTPPQLVNS